MVLGALCFVVMAALLSLTFITGNVVYFILVFVDLSFQGVGLGLFATPATGSAVNATPGDRAGVASGIFKMASSLGEAFGIAIHLAIYGAIADSSGDLQRAAMFSIGFGVIAACGTSLYQSCYSALCSA